MRALRKLPRFLFITQVAVKYAVTHRTLDGIVTLTATVANHPIVGIDAALEMVNKRDRESVTRSPALEDA